MKTVTPSGVEIEFVEVPRRGYLVNGEKLPSVTSVLGCLDKPALPWWGMTVGVKGVLELLERDIALDGDPDSVVKALTAHKLTVNHVVNAAADRGKGVHDALEQLALHDTIPNPLDFAEEERGYVRAVCEFWADNDPECIDAETLVASPTHGFAGRYDLRARIGGKVHLLDLKTSKGIYESHYLQLEAYDLAARECGYGDSDIRSVVRVGADGSYEVGDSYCKPEHFLAVLDCYKALQEIKKAKPRKSKAA